MKSLNPVATTSPAQNAGDLLGREAGARDMSPGDLETSRRFCQRVARIAAQLKPE
jgi:hypothetical protein